MILSNRRLTAGWKRISSLHENSAILPKGSTSAWKAKTKIFPAATDWLPFTSDNGKKNSILTKQTGYIPLEHRPGEAQADFGTADFYENGKLHHEAKYLVLSFPYSNGGFFQLNYGENMECLLEGLVAIFEHIGGVPTEIWFDNTRTIVTKIIKGGGRNITERFQRFCEHYRINPVHEP